VQNGDSENTPHGLIPSWLSCHQRESLGSLAATGECVCVRERKREKVRKRERDRWRERQRHRLGERQTMCVEDGSGWEPLK
jgi:hypothetical protein